MPSPARLPPEPWAMPDADRTEHDYAIFALDLKGFATTWNEDVERLLGWPREEFIGLTSEKLFSPEDVAKGMQRQELRTAAEEGSSASEHWLLRKDGTPFFAACIFSRAIDASGHVIGFTVVLHDRTAGKRAEEEREALLETERKVRQ